MIKHDELLLMVCIFVADEKYPNIRGLAANLSINEKRAAYILQKWSDKGFYDYGCSVMSGWLTDEGEAHVRYTVCNA